MRIFISGSSQEEIGKILDNEVKGIIIMTTEEYENILGGNSPKDAEGNTKGGIIRACMNHSLQIKDNKYPFPLVRSESI